MYHDIGEMIEGLDDEFDADIIDVSGIDELDDEVGAALRFPSSRGLLQRTARIRPSRALARTRVGQAAAKLAKVSRQLLVQTGRIEADYLRRPNTLVSVYTPVIAPGATSAFSVTPGVGNSFYRLLGFICTDEQANIFGFSALRVGGQDHVQFTQATPAAPVTSAVPWAIFALKEGRLIANLAPWTGQVFDQSSPVTGTIVNMTVAASGDAVTVAARGVFLTQTDPCGYRYTQMTEQSKGWWASMRRNVGAYAPLLLGR